MLTYEFYRNNPDEFRKHRAKPVPLNCCSCHTLYYKSPRIARSFRNQEKNFCSRECLDKHNSKSFTLPCANCQQLVTRVESHKARFKNVFCNSSCAAKYNNTHKTTGNRRSKMEAYLEEQLKVLYPNLQIIANGKEVIESELDLYFPELRFAIELNGIFHYEPIYGQDKLEQIQNNDKQKMIRCYQKGIELMVMDVSAYKKFNPKTAIKYLNIVKDQLDLIMKRKEPQQTI